MPARILILEDESSIADNIRYGLEAEGFIVTWCTTLAEAKQCLAAGGIDLLVLDVGLPDGNGYDFCKELRKSSPLPVIFLTARSGEIDRIVGLEIGADDYLVKPFSPRELAARVKAIFRRGTAFNAHGTQAGVAAKPKTRTPFFIDSERMKIFYFEQALPLSRYEFRLLRVLVERPGRVLSRDQLMELAWEEPEASLDRTVDAHIKSLRAKMRRVKADLDPIETHRGLGYSLKENW
ncbi:MAG TPA: two-component system response regulator CreB [Deltaproteobacteria bacterium]|nr:two-component system response regulator CreB [Deltaproteobacteria bacterium]